MDEALSIDGIEGIERVWSLHSASTGSTRLLCSTAYNSFLLQIEPIVEVLPLAAEVTDLPLFAASAIQGKVVVVNKHGVQLWEGAMATAQTQLESSSEEAEVVAAQIHGDHIALALRGGSARVHRVQGGVLDEVWKYVISVCLPPCRTIADRQDRKSRLRDIVNRLLADLSISSRAWHLDEDDPNLRRV